MEVVTSSTKALFTCKLLHQTSIDIQHLCMQSNRKCAITLVIFFGSLPNSPFATGSCHRAFCRGNKTGRELLGPEIYAVPFPLILGKLIIAICPYEIFRPSFRFFTLRNNLASHPLANCWDIFQACPPTQRLILTRKGKFQATGATQKYRNYCSLYLLI